MENALEFTWIHHIFSSAQLHPVTRGVLHGVAALLQPEVSRGSDVHQRRGYAVAAERRALSGPAARLGSSINCGRLENLRTKWRA